MVESRQRTSQQGCASMRAKTCSGQFVQRCHCVRPEMQLFLCRRCPPQRPAWKIVRVCRSASSGQTVTGKMVGLGVLSRNADGISIQGEHAIATCYISAETGILSDSIDISLKLMNIIVMKILILRGMSILSGVFTSCFRIVETFSKRPWAGESSIVESLPMDPSWHG